MTAELGYTYQPRAPRYQLTPGDPQYLKFKTESGDLYEANNILNISISGMAFLVSNEVAPKENTFIVLELILPTNHQIACYAQVIRTEIFYLDSHKTLVAIKYQNLNFLQRRFFKEELEKCFKKAHWKMVKTHPIHLFLYAISGCLMLLNFWSLSRFWPFQL